MFKLKNIYHGAVLGVSTLIPGVSGGTIAIILGIYDHLLEAISGFFSKDWKDYIGFIISIGIGAVASLLMLSRLINFFLDNYPKQIQFLFLGLVIGALPLLLKEADVKNTFKGSHIALMVVSAILVGSMTLITPSTTAEIIELTLISGVVLFLAGCFASMSLLLPGISSSLVLLIIGVYSTATYALATLNIPLIIIIGSGVAVGVVASSRGIKYLLKNHFHMTYAAIIGMSVGSIVVVFPGMAQSVGGILACIGTFVLGSGTVLLLTSKK